jgi:hypothetical protein
MKLLTNLKNWIGGIFKDESGVPSSKRLVGVLCATTLCVTMYHNSFSTTDIAPATPLVDAVALLAFGCLGLSSVDKFTSAKKGVQDALTRDPAPKKEEPVSNPESTTCPGCSQEPCTCGM